MRTSSVPIPDSFDRSGDVAGNVPLVMVSEIATVGDGDADALGDGDPDADTPGDGEARGRWFLPNFGAARTARGQLSLLIQYHDSIGTGGDMHVYALLHAWISG